MKNLKKVFKNCAAMQCSSCGKWIQSVMFSQHVEQCGENSVYVREKTQTDLSCKEGIHVNVSQSVSKQNDDKKKVFLEYVIQVAAQEKKWKVCKQYRQFT